VPNISCVELCDFFLEHPVVQTEQRIQLTFSSFQNCTETGANMSDLPVIAMHFIKWIGLRTQETGDWILGDNLKLSPGIYFAFIVPSAQSRHPLVITATTQPVWCAGPDTYSVEEAASVSK